MLCEVWEPSPQGLANTASAWTTVAVTDSELLEAVGPAALCKIW